MYIKYLSKYKVVITSFGSIPKNRITTQRHKYFCNIHIRSIYHKVQVNDIRDKLISAFQWYPAHVMWEREHNITKFPKAISPIPSSPLANPDPTTILAAKNRALLLIRTVLDRCYLRPQQKDYFEVLIEYKFLTRTQT